MRELIVLDTDVAGDPDDALALVAAARVLSQPPLVITTDECGGERARFARHLLDLLGRPDVPVVSGADLGNTGTSASRAARAASAPVPGTRRSWRGSPTC